MFEVRIEIGERTFDIRGEEDMKFLRPCPIEECEGIIFGRRLKKIAGIYDTELGEIKLGDLDEKKRRQIEKEVTKALIIQDGEAFCADCLLRELEEDQGEGEYCLPEV